MVYNSQDFKENNTSLNDQPPENSIKNKIYTCEELEGRNMKSSKSKFFNSHSILGTEGRKVSLFPRFLSQKVRSLIFIEILIHLIYLTMAVDIINNGKV